MNDLSTPLKTQLKALPKSPGVYIFRGAKRKILYVGKATSLRDRVRSYFSGGDSRGERIRQMVEQIRTIETRETDTVLEAVILEANCIKKYRPKYNIDQKDDKSFTFIAITKEDFPRILLLRETDLLGNGKKNLIAPKDIMRTYGPYPSKSQVQTVLKIIRKIFPYHDRRGKSEKGCLSYQIGLCPGPFSGDISKAKYRKNISHIEQVLRGKKKRLLLSLEKSMQKFAKEENFEQAKRLRDTIFALKHIRDIALLKKDFSGSIQGFHGSSSMTQSSRIEGYDISHLSGKQAVASMVVFEEGESKKSEYRKFKIRTIEGIDDTGMMREVLGRRFQRDDWKRPQNILLDGGKGHLNMAEKVFLEMNISNVGLLSLAKGPTRKKLDLYISEVFPPNEGVEKDMEILEKVRDESHRFAVSYHKLLRKKEFLQ